MTYCGGGIPGRGATHMTSFTTLRGMTKGCPRPARRLGAWLITEKSDGLILQAVRRGWAGEGRTASEASVESRLPSPQDTVGEQRAQLHASLGQKGQARG